MDFGELMDESFERAGIDMSGVTNRHIQSARRSLDLLLSEIDEAGAQGEYRTLTQRLTLQPNQFLVALPEDTIDVIEATIEQPNGGGGYVASLNLNRTNRRDWHGLADKKVKSIPSLYWVSKSSPQDMAALFDEQLTTPWGMQAWGSGTWGGEISTHTVIAATPAPVLVLWPGVTRDSTLLLSRLRSAKPPTMLDDEVDARRNWLEIIASGLASRLAEKFNYDRHSALESKYMGKLRSRMNQQNEGDIQIGYRAFGWSRQRRH